MPLSTAEAACNAGLCCADANWRCHVGDCDNGAEDVVRKRVASAAAASLQIFQQSPGVLQPSHHFAFFWGHVMAASAVMYK